MLAIGNGIASLPQCMLKVMNIKTQQWMKSFGSWDVVAQSSLPYVNYHRGRRKRQRNTKTFRLAISLSPAVLGLIVAPSSCNLTCLSLLFHGSEHEKNTLLHSNVQTFGLVAYDSDHLCFVVFFTSVWFGRAFTTTYKLGFIFILITRNSAFSNLIFIHFIPYSIMTSCIVSEPISASLRSANSNSTSDNGTFKTVSCAFKPSYTITYIGRTLRIPKSRRLWLTQSILQTTQCSYMLARRHPQTTR